MTPFLALKADMQFLSDLDLDWEFPKQDHAHFIQLIEPSSSSMYSMACCSAKYPLLTEFSAVPFSSMSHFLKILELWDICSLHRIYPVTQLAQHKRVIK